MTVCGICLVRWSGEPLSSLPQSELPEGQKGLACLEFSVFLMVQALNDTQEGGRKQDEEGTPSPRPSMGARGPASSQGWPSGIISGGASFLPLPPLSLSPCHLFSPTSFMWVFPQVSVPPNRKEPRGHGAESPPLSASSVNLGGSGPVVLDGHHKMIQCFVSQSGGAGLSGAQAFGGLGSSCGVC